jgi:hypothetical protein
MNDINKDELLDINKWKRFFFMVIYSFAIHGVVGIFIIIAAVQFFFYLFTSKINNQLQSANNWLHGFFSDSLNFLSFNTDAKPWPFNDKAEESESAEEVDVVEVVSEEVNLDENQPEQTTP